MHEMSLPRLRFNMPKRGPAARVLTSAMRHVLCTSHISVPDSLYLYGFGNHLNRSG